MDIGTLFFQSRFLELSTSASRNIIYNKKMHNDNRQIDPNIPFSASCAQKAHQKLLIILLSVHIQTECFEAHANRKQISPRVTIIRGSLCKDTCANLATRRTVPKRCSVTPSCVILILLLPPLQSNHRIGQGQLGTIFFFFMNLKLICKIGNYFYHLVNGRS